MAASKPLQASDVLSSPVVASDAEHLDPELLELFIEEAKEEIASIQRNLPAWADAPDDMETLITVRRSFHTLKGSGRMVGAERIGEYCWSIENLLNKLINRTLMRTPPMVSFIVDASALVPELVEQLEVGAEPKSDVALYMARANAFADGDPDASVLTLAVDSREIPAAEDDGLEMDPVLLDIFSKETAGHLQILRDFTAAADAHEPPYSVTDKLHRACHTLHGSANMANVERGVAVAGALNRFIRRLYDHDSGVTSDGIRALTKAADAIDAIVSDINQPDRDRQDYSGLIDELNQLANDVEISAPADGADSSDAQPVADSAEPEDDSQYDAEIAAIFSEEAAELLEAADLALTEWSRNPGSREHLDELKRHLHTLKGGARMAGIMPMGNLSHELETLIIGVDDGRIESDDSLSELMQSSIDELHRMRDVVIAGKRVSTATELETRIRAHSSGQPETPVSVVRPDEAEKPDASSDDSVSVEFSVEPEEAVSMVILDSLGEGDEGGSDDAANNRSAADETPDEVEPDLPSSPEVPEAIEAADVSAPEEIEEPKEATAYLKPDERLLSDAEEDSAELPDAGAEVEQPAPDAGTPDEVVIPPAAVAPAQPPRQTSDARQEFARIDATLLEDLLNAAGEVSIYQSRLSQQVSSLEFNLEELEQTVARLREQLRKLDIETEAQITHGHQETVVSKDFDPLEMDRYSNIQQLSRALAESANDVASLKDLLQSQTSEAETLLVQQARVTAELQNGLMRTRMVPFQRHVSRLTRLVRQAATEAGKRAELAVEGASGELDRQVLDKMLPPFEHMLRNAVVHGIESPEERQAAGKPAGGRLTIRLHREGAEMVIDVADDGAGLDVDAIRRKAYEKGLLKPDAKASDAEIMDLILRPGFSTAEALTQSAGRGVGMDVVANEVKQLGGSLQIASVTGHGTNFTVRLPFTLAITQALIVRTGEEVYALPLPTVEGVVRVARAELEKLLSQSEPTYQYGEESYRFRHLGMYLGGQAARLPDDESFVPIILVRAGDYSAALLIDEMIASQEIVVKSLGPQLSSVRGISGATILGDGRIVLILDINSLVRAGAPVVELKTAAPIATDERPIALVVDDSITVRRVMERFLERSGLQVVTAKDGLDAISVLSDTKPDIILLDIEMPRMDGYEFATHVRNDERAADVPIIMITSRAGDKHRARAIEIGVNDYLGKPYQESQLLDAISRLLAEKGISLQ